MIFPPPKRRTRKLRKRKSKVYEVTNISKSIIQQLQNRKKASAFKTDLLIDQHNGLSYTINDYENYKSSINELITERGKFQSLISRPYKEIKKLTNFENFTMRKRKKYLWDESEPRIDEIQKRREDIIQRFLCRVKDIDQLIKDKYNGNKERRRGSKGGANKKVSRSYRHRYRGGTRERNRSLMNGRLPEEYYVEGRAEALIEKHRKERILRRKLEEKLREQRELELRYPAHQSESVSGFENQGSSMELERVGLASNGDSSRLGVGYQGNLGPALHTLGDREMELFKGRTGLSKTSESERAKERADGLSLMYEGNINK